MKESTAVVPSRKTTPFEKTEVPLSDELPVAEIRKQFPALNRKVNGRGIVFFDGPAGSQVPQTVVDAVAGYLTECNANHGGVFPTSRTSDAWLARAHQAVADFLGADDPACVIFGPNMTTLTFALSRALGRTWRDGDEVIVTRLDHDANVSPWRLAAADAGAEVIKIDIRPADCTLDLDQLRDRLSPRTRLVAVGAASNAVGTVNPIRDIVQLAHAVGALVFVDAVHFAPHRRIDVSAWGCDFVACSAYKFFGPHVGILWGRRDLLADLPAYKLRPVSEQLPDRWMTGTQNHEGIVGTLAAIDYLAQLGSGDRKTALTQAFNRIRDHEQRLCRRLLDGLDRLPGVRVWGIRDVERIDERVSTVAVTHETIPPRELAVRLADHGIFTWHGNYYALELTEALGLEPHGMLRIGLLHYNTIDEVDRLLETLETCL